MRWERETSEEEQRWIGSGNAGGVNQLALAPNAFLGHLWLTSLGQLIPLGASIKLIQVFPLQTRNRTKYRSSKAAIEVSWWLRLSAPYRHHGSNKRWSRTDQSGGCVHFDRNSWPVGITHFAQLHDNQTHRIHTRLMHKVTRNLDNNQLL